LSASSVDPEVLTAVGQGCQEASAVPGAEVNDAPLRGGKGVDDCPRNARAEIRHTAPILNAHKNPDTPRIPAATVWPETNCAFEAFSKQAVILKTLCR
jgi:hypothetical protein